jgi:hypothetical protein
MKKLVFYIVILIFLFSCKSQQITFSSIRGIFEGTETFYYVELELNQDRTCSLRKTFDLSKIECQGEWSMLNSNLIEIKCNINPILSDIEKALQGGSYIEGNLEIKILSENKLKLGNTILKRKK